MAKTRPTLLMTRPEAASRRFVEGLDYDLMRSVRVIVSPLIRIEWLAGELDLVRVGGVIFTSANGVGAASRVVQPDGTPAFCVGPATTMAAERAGWSAHQMGHDAESLVTAVLEARPAGPLVHIRGEHARGDVAQRLSDAGLSCEEAVLYAQTAQPLSADAVSALDATDPVIAPVFSPRTAQLLSKDIRRQAIQIAALSAAVAEALGTLANARVAIARAPNAQEMTALVEKLLHSAMPG